MGRFQKTIDECPENVRNFVAQTVLANEHARICREIDQFANLAICLGYNLVAPCRNVRAMFNAVSDLFDQEEKTG